MNRIIYHVDTLGNYGTNVFFFPHVMFGLLKMNTDKKKFENPFYKKKDNYFLVLIYYFFNYKTYYLEILWIHGC